ncbi:adenylate/guanylate cyclase domain-containing protein [Thermodesulfobacteriota bacterium]
MMEKRVKRKLSAILSADAVDYSRLMGDDEVSTVRTLESYRTVMSDLIEQFRGRVVDSPGDNLLAEFSSVVDAVQCAVEIHEVIRAKNEELPEGRRMLFRIGVNLGDVIEEGDRIYGDGVNIAARLEGLAEPGGVCISGSAHEQIENKLALGYEYLGEHTVKNIVKPVKVYKVPMGAKALIEEKKKEKKPKLKKTSTAPGVKEGAGETGVRQILPWVAAAVILTAIIVGVVIWNMRVPEPKQVVRFTYELPEDQQFSRSPLSSLAVSPDGNRFIYCTAEGIRIRSIAEFNSSLIPGTELAIEPCFSPDGQWICYWSDSQMKKIALTGGAPVSLMKPSSYPYGVPAWGEDDWIVYSIRGAIMRIPANGGAPETLLKEETIINAPQILPGGKSVLYAVGSAPTRVVVQSLESGERRELFEGDTPRYLPTKHIVYTLENNLFAIAFDPDRLEVKGGPVSLVEGIARRMTPQYAVSDSGTLVYVPSESTAAGPERILVWVDRKGEEESLPAEPNNYLDPRISPDGTKMALSFNTGGNKDIWIWDLVRETMKRLTFDEATDTFPLWTPDGRRITFLSIRDPMGLYWKAADGTGEVEMLGSALDLLTFPSSWSGDGKTLVFCKNTNYTENKDIGIMFMEGDRGRTLLLSEMHKELQPKISPDGKWMAYASDESGKAEIYVRPFPDVNKGRWQVSVNGGHSPLWSPDGHEIFYRNGDSVMAVPVETEQGFSQGKPEELFRGPYTSSSLSLNQTWDISPDGNRFMMMKQPGTEVQIKINIVVNWLDELKQKVPMD